MRIGIIGGGNVGTALAGAFARAGHAPVLLRRDPAAPGAAPGATPSAPLAPLDGAEAYVLATPYAAAVGALSAVRPGAVPVIDATNPLEMGADGLGLSIGHSTSAAEEIARALPGLRLVKCFNTAGFGVLAEAGRFAPKPVMFAASEDDEARALALRLAADIGFDPVDAGPLRAARLLEAHAMLWIELAAKRGLGRDIAFALLRA
ncbi:NADPH-dependent F420 reductase [Falsiroseomonas sp. HW251]|uniref:NADPH-dependent F420 reductase n=1 Tax=Falsiroseomonas sp. HW251 TaxID=3390998 RepID=UPI003D31D558